jgi:predicted Fe-Mo cluster-binding NifX family protein
VLFFSAIIFSANHKTIITMNKKVAVPINHEGVLDEHFGHCKYFALFETNGKIISNNQIVLPPPHEPGVLPQWLADEGVTDVLAGGMGNRAIQIFNQNGINVFVGAPKSARTGEWFYR